VVAGAGHLFCKYGSGVGVRLFVCGLDPRSVLVKFIGWDTLVYKIKIVLIVVLLFAVIKNFALCRFVKIKKL